MTKVCASVGSLYELQNVSSADLVEIRMDIFDRIPENLDRPVVVKITDRKQILECLELGKNNYIDVGEFGVPIAGQKIITSFHNNDMTPKGHEIAEILDMMGGDICKGAFKINRPADLMSIYDASKLIKKPHILVGMGEMGAVTRIRSDMLGNEFMYSHTGTPTAEGQLTVEEMCGVKDDVVILGLLGHPLSHSASKMMMIRALADCKIPGFYFNFDTSTLDRIDDVIRCYGIRGMNITHPFKMDISAFLDSLDETAERTSSVNTVLNSDGKLIGYNTDVYGAKYAIEKSGLTMDSGMKVLILGSGGVARSCIYALSDYNAEITVAGRNRKTVSDIKKDFGCSVTDCRDPKGYDMIVNCTPIGMYSEDIYPIDITQITEDQVVFDVTYGRQTPLSNTALEHRCRIVSGLDMLVGQGAKSFEIWTGKTPDLTSMRGSIV